MNPRFNYDSASDKALVRAFLIALEDPGIEKLRCLCWIVNGIKKLPKQWTHDRKLLEMGDSE